VAISRVGDFIGDSGFEKVGRRPTRVKKSKADKQEKDLFYSCKVSGRVEICRDMSHHTIETSPPGTPLEARGVGEIVAGHPGLSRVFQAHGIDFCCQGGRTLRDACERKGVDLKTVVGELEAATAVDPEPRENPAELPASELADYIVATHHGYLRDELPRLHAMAERVANVHGPHTPSLKEVHEVFAAMMTELAEHMVKEEEMLFPAIRSAAKGERVMPLDGPINCMLHEHDDAGAALVRLRELTAGYQPPPEACNTYRALFAGLADLEEDLHRHIHLENSVLFPAAQTMQERAAS
jgi:regulator of cell morphogenesis and NO signaling